MDNETTDSDTVTEQQEPPAETAVQTGSIDPDFKMLANSLAVYSTTYALDSEKERVEFGKRAMVGAIAGVAPRDTIEVMMASQLAALYSAIMLCTCRAIGDRSYGARDMELGHATRLSKAFTNLLEAFNRYREKNGKPHAPESAAPSQSA
jgi:hypothetical protein